MPPLSDLPGEINRAKFLNALVRLGFVIDMSGGKGSHCKVTWPKTQKSITILERIPKQSLKYILKQIEVCSGLTWDDIKKHL